MKQLRKLLKLGSVVIFVQKRSFERKQNLRNSRNQSQKCTKEYSVPTSVRSPYCMSKKKQSISPATLKLNRLLKVGFATNFEEISGKRKFEKKVQEDSFRPYIPPNV